jgi:transcription factor WhiB
MTVQTLVPAWKRSQGVDWQDSAACRENPTAEYAFLHGNAEERRQAIRTYCGVCPVKKECALFGDESQSWGVWGGEFHERSGSPNRSHPEHDDLVNEVATMYLNGFSIVRISAIVRRTDETVKKLLIESGTPFRSNVIKTRVEEFWDNA